jgi:hypothetical protein
VKSGVIGASYLALAVTVAIVAMFFYMAPVRSIGGAMVVRDLDSIVTLTSSVNSITDNYYDTYQTPRGTDYLVPAGKKLYVTHLEGNVIKGAGNERIMLGYSTATVSNSASAPTGAVIMVNFTFEESDVNTKRHAVTFVVPGGFYPFIHIDGGGAIQATGYLR